MILGNLVVPLVFKQFPESLGNIKGREVAQIPLGTRRNQCPPAK